ncbi:glycosyltransferase family 4 protein [Planococcus sp. N064]|uniref:Glycosyltransferase family 4 protein n=1 Tax=Planococcus liqunii TaxID=3058394 RepID=A0ABT8MNC3_9BACL|nr:glycosyltransferase family 4 protein [Planococcus sp. N064]MDN7226399.1 glycosyltransferase family 4 protein [Planococcus sp. N064]
MKILFESYSTVKQNVAGGVNAKIKLLYEGLQQKNITIDFFNKWEDKLTNYDVLHIFRLSEENYALAATAKSSKVPIIISTILQVDKKWIISANLWLTKLLPIHTGYSKYKEMLGLADAVITETKKEAEFIAKVYKVDRKKISVIPDIPLVNAKDADPSLIQQRISSKKDFILQVARFDQNKNQLNVIKAMKGSDIPIVFIGGEDHNNQNYYEECKKEATDNMHFLGWLDASDPLLSSAFCSAKVVVMPSFQETMGTVAIEGGMAGANLVIAKDLPILETGIEKYCKQIDPRNIKEIRNSLVAAYEEKLNREEVRGQFEKIFSPKVIMQMHIDIYEKVLSFSHQEQVKNGEVIELND